MTRTKFHASLTTTFERVAPLALGRFGKNAQMIKAIEEMGELTQALAKYLNSSVITFEVMDEICDVLIMANQLRMLFDPEWIDERMILKLLRTETYIHNHPVPPPSVL